MDIQVQKIAFNPKLKGEILIVQGYTFDTDINNKFVVTEVNNDTVKLLSLQPFGHEYTISDEDLKTLKITHVPVSFNPNFELEESK